MSEIWKDIPGFEGLYQVSNLGRVKSLPRQIWNGKGYFVSKEKILHPNTLAKGYFQVELKKNTNLIKVLKKRPSYNTIKGYKAEYYEIQ